MTALHELHDDHATLRPAVDALRTTAERVDEPIAALRHAVDADRLYLHAELLPHLDAEEAVLYPALRQAMHSETATVGMEHDHAQIRLLAAAVADIDADLAATDRVSEELAHRIRRVFLGLHALLLNHFGKEEAIYHPYLVRELSPQRRQDLVAAVEAAATRAALEATS